MSSKASSTHVWPTYSDLGNHSQGNTGNIVQYFALGWSYEAGVGAKKSRVVVTTKRSICGSQGWENALLTATLGDVRAGLASHV